MDIEQRLNLDRGIPGGVFWIDPLPGNYTVVDKVIISPCFRRLNKKKPLNRCKSKRHLKYAGRVDDPAVSGGVL